jgi:hypothetical protein
VGIRYWLSPSMGLDLGVGFGYASGSTDSSQNGMTTSIDSPSVLAMALHGGLPLVFAHGKHYSFEAIPELTVGFATSATKGTGGNADTSLTGSRIEAGARVGAEIYFGFIGIPELALEASVGLAVRRNAWKASRDAAGMGSPAVSASAAQFTIGTTVDGDPWAIFVNNISAIYYF